MDKKRKATATSTRPADDRRTIVSATYTGPDRRYSERRDVSVVPDVQ